MKKPEICIHCNADYIPTRRGVQKFCSKSCKSRYWYLKQNFLTKDLPVINQNIISTQNLKEEKISLASVGNTVVGVAVVEATKYLLTAPENKPATKKDIQELKALIKGHYLPIKNMDKNAFGQSPFYDVETGNVVFLYL
jgi:hypothetical protein